MTHEEHRKRHADLHRAMDELLSDYMYHHRDQLTFLDMPLRELIDWSYTQTIHPTPGADDESRPRS